MFFYGFYFFIGYFYRDWVYEDIILFELLIKMKNMREKQIFGKVVCQFFENEIIFFWEIVVYSFYYLILFCIVIVYIKREVCDCFQLSFYKFIF